jgi:putative addiction module component (TIGR02574 family)
VSIKDLEVEMMKLDPEDRVLLSEKLLGSVPPELVYESEWTDEINRRVEEIRNGTARLVSTEDMLREALESLE